MFYEIVGVYPSQSFFSINNATGQISISQDLRNDGLKLTQYTVGINAPVISISSLNLYWHAVESICALIIVPTKYHYFVHAWAFVHTKYYVLNFYHFVSI